MQVSYWLRSFLTITFVSDNKKVFGGFELFNIAHASKLLAAFVSDNNVRF